MTKRRRRSLLLTGEFLLACALVHGVGIRLLERVDLAPFEGSREYVRALEELEAPPGPDDWFLAYDGGSADHHALYHDVLGTTEYLRAADCLVLGTSQAQVAFRQVQLEPGLARLGLGYYNLAFGHKEPYSFTLELCRHLDLEPAVVVVNVHGFLEPGESDTAREVVAGSRFDAWKRVYEKRAAFHLHRQLHRVYPLRSVSAGSQWLILRSVQHGSWHVVPTRPDPRPFTPAPDVEPAADELVAARELVTFFTERGTDVIFTAVPTRGESQHRARRLAAKVGVPFVDVDPSGLELIDGSHLTPESAERFSRDFLAGFEALWPLED